LDTEDSIKDKGKQHFLEVEGSSWMVIDSFQSNTGSNWFVSLSPSLLFKIDGELQTHKQQNNRSSATQITNRKKQSLKKR
jgi:hypothetical protein